MNDTIESIKCQALTLPIQDRAELASFLLSSLHEGEEEDPAAVEKAWDLELAKRLEEIESGKAIGIPAEQVLEEMRRKYP
jgi:putative addiction module component (TIGR02574 family)